LQVLRLEAQRTEMAAEVGGLTAQLEASQRNSKAALERVAELSEQESLMTGLLDSKEQQLAEALQETKRQAGLLLEQVQVRKNHKP
jgi:hypothetical protein